MIIHKKKKAVVLKLRHPSRVTTVITTSKQVGDHTVAVPHRPDETQILRNLGFAVPDPMPLHYVWPKVSGVHDPFAAQLATGSFLSMNRRAFCLNEFGTGKSNSTLWAYDYLRRVKAVKRMLVVCPLSTMERTWADSVFQTFPDLEAVVLYGSRERRLKLLKQEADIYIINIDGLDIIRDALKGRPDIDLIAVDELAMARNAQTKRWKTLNAICNIQHPNRRVWGLTGSPTPNAPTDAWAQMRLVTPSNQDVPKFFGRFKGMVMKQVSPFKWIARPQANDVVHSLMQPAIRFSLDDCVDLPEQIIVHRDVELTKQQDKAYKEMLATLATEVAGGQVLAVNEAVKAGKLVQIACLAAGTNVLTNSGWVPIEKVATTDCVWDGVEWVSHDGLVDRGRRSTILRNGVRMTPDHRVLTTVGWKEAKEVRDGCAGEGFDRVEVRLPTGTASERFDARQDKVRDVGLPMRLWKHSDQGRPESEKDDTPQRAELRLQARSVEQNPWAYGQSSVALVDRNETTVPESEQQGLCTLWGQGRDRLRAVAAFVRELLGGYGGFIPARANARPRGQRRALRAVELSMGDPYGAGEQSAQKTNGYSQPGIAADRRTRADDLHANRQHEEEEPVFDLSNCGPRSRFVVRGTDGRLSIVHNCGVTYGLNGEYLALDAKPRTDLVKEIIEASEGKVIVFVPLTGALYSVASEIGKSLPGGDDEVAIVHGDTSKNDRDRIFGEFQNGNRLRVLVANAQTMSHGLTLTAATTIVWYAPVNSQETYSQACARVRRPGQKKKTVIVHIAGTDVERKIYKRLEAKQTMQGILLDMVKEGGLQ